MPGLDGLEAIRRISARLPKVRILVLTSFAGDDKIFPAIRAGAMGYLLKNVSADDLARACEGLNDRPAAMRYYDEMLRFWGNPDYVTKDIRDARLRVATLRS